MARVPEPGAGGSCRPLYCCRSTRARGTADVGSPVGPRCKLLAALYPRLQTDPSQDGDPHHDRRQQQHLANAPLRHVLCNTVTISLRPTRCPPLPDSPSLHAGFITTIWYASSGRARPAPLHRRWTQRQASKQYMIKKLDGTNRCSSGQPHRRGFELLCAATRQQCIGPLRAEVFFHEDGGPARPTATLTPIVPANKLHCVRRGCQASNINDHASGCLIAAVQARCLACRPSASSPSRAPAGCRIG